MQELLSKINWNQIITSSSGKIVLTLVTIIILSLLIDFFMARSVFGRSYRYFVAPGIIVHELSHALMCLLTGAKIHNISLFDKEGGSVEHVKSKIPVIGPILISMAPIFIGGAAIFVLARAGGIRGVTADFSLVKNFDVGGMLQLIKQSFGALDFHQAKNWILLYLVLSIAVTMAPSKRDFLNIVSAVIIFVAILFAVYKYTSINLNLNWLITGEVLTFITTIIFLLILSLVLSIIVFAISKLFKLS